GSSVVWSVPCQSACAQSETHSVQTAIRNGCRRAMVVMGALWPKPLELVMGVLYKLSVITPARERRKRVANAEKEKAIELAVSAIEKRFGKGSVMRRGVDVPLVQAISAICAGSASLAL